MKSIDITLTDHARARTIPICVYTPLNTGANIPVVIFGPGYQGQDTLTEPEAKLECKNYEYLAEFFTNKNYAFISIQHDILGDNDGLETIDPNAVQAEVRKHLWVRGEQNIIFVINELKQRFPEFYLDKFIIAGHSNGGDIAKFYANNHPEQISSVITLDARRCPIKPAANLRLLMFEALDTSTDLGVIPDQGTEQNPKRVNLEWVIIKPHNATHISYNGGYITDEIKQVVFRGIDWFLGDGKIKEDENKKIEIIRL
jgi:pimeloyl-ACP methyl ester carboxylesterase